MKRISLFAFTLAAFAAGIARAGIEQGLAQDGIDIGVKYRHRLAGADDRIFRVDRAELRECAELVTDRKELAALRQK